jgi:hypothetical protein
MSRFVLAGPRRKGQATITSKKGGGSFEPPLLPQPKNPSTLLIRPQHEKGVQKKTVAKKKIFNVV